MGRNKIILIVVLLLVIVGVGYLVFSSFNSHEDLNVTNKSITNSSLDVNRSSNNSADDNLYDDDLGSNEYSSYNDYSDSNDDSDSKSSSKSDEYDEPDDEYTASDIREMVKKGKGSINNYNMSELKVGKPKYKNELWKVPIYDKKTGKFVDNVYMSKKHMPIAQNC